MADSIILLEERKEVTTFLLDEGTITATTKLQLSYWMKVPSLQLL